MKAKPLACPWCGATVSKVIDSRADPITLKDQLTYSGDGYWRKRQCQSCRGCFTSEEVVTGRSEPPSNIL